MVAVILFIGVVILGIVNAEHDLISPFFLVSYGLFIFCIVFNENFKHHAVFVPLAVLIPFLEFIFIGPENFDARGNFIDSDVRGVFTRWGYVGIGLCAILAPFVAFGVNLFSHSMSKIGDKH